MFEVQDLLGGDGKTMRTLAFTPMATGINANLVCSCSPYHKDTHSYAGLHASQLCPPHLLSPTHIKISTESVPGCLSQPSDKAKRDKGIKGKETSSKEGRDGRNTYGVENI